MVASIFLTLAMCGAFSISYIGTAATLGSPPSRVVYAWGFDKAGGTDVPDDLGEVSTIAASNGNGHVLALRVDGSVSAWGLNSEGQTNVPLNLGGVIAIDAGSQHSVALKSDGTLVAWGDNSSGQTSVPSDLGKIVQIAAGSNHNLALLEDGRIVAWGSNEFGQTEVPEGIQSVKELAAGASFSAALLTDGSIVTWGQIDEQSIIGPSEASDVLTIEAGPQHILALLRSGEVLAWGNESSGRLDIPEGLNNVDAIAAGGSHSLALQADGTLVGWGRATHGEIVPPIAFGQIKEIAAGSRFSVILAETQQPIFLSSPSAITANPGHTIEYRVGVLPLEPVSYQWFHNDEMIPGAESEVLILENIDSMDAGTYRIEVADGEGDVSSSEAPLEIVPRIGANRRPGTVVVWGSDSDTIMKPPTDLNDVVSVEAGSFHIVALRENGHVVAWGDNSRGQTDVPPTLENVVQIAAANHYSAALLSTGEIHIWGTGPNNNEIPSRQGLTIAMAAGDAHMMTLDNEGIVSAFGSNRSGQLNIPDGLSEIVSISAGSEHSVALSRDGTVSAWGRAGFQIFPPTNSLRGITAIDSGGNEALALGADGRVFVLGSLKLNIGGPALKPESLSAVRLIASGQFHSYVLSGPDDLAGWGAFGTGDNTAPDDLRGILDITIGREFSAAVLSPELPIVTMDASEIVAQEGHEIVFSATIHGKGPFRYQWAHNNVEISGREESEFRIERARLEDEGNYQILVTDRDGFSSQGITKLKVLEVPFAKPSHQPRAYGWGMNSALVRTGNSLQRLVAMDLGPGYGIAAHGDGSLSIWGDIPIEVLPDFADLPPIIGVAAGASHFVALGENGQAFSWGDNTSGQLDITLDSGRFTALDVGAYFSLGLGVDGRVRVYAERLSRFFREEIAVPHDLRFVSAIAAGDRHCLALKADGSIVVWGNNDRGQLNIPGDLSEILAIDSGSFYSLALRRDGKVFAWGDNSLGQTDVPAELENVVAITAGSEHALALTADGDLIGWGQSANGRREIPSGLKDISAIVAGHEESFVMLETAAPIALNTRETVTISPGHRLRIPIEAISHSEVSYEWKKEGTIITDVTGPVFELDSATESAAGQYEVRIGDTNGLETVSQIQVEVVPPRPILTAKPRRLAYAKYDGVYSLPDDAAGERFISIASSENNALALQINGNLLAWKLGSREVVTPLAIPPSLAKIKFIDVNGNRAGAIDADGSIYEWMLDDGELLPSPTAARNLAEVSIGSDYTLARTTSGHVIAWGKNGAEQLDVPQGLENVVAVATGSNHSMALKRDGTIVAWGGDERGQSTVPPGLVGVVEIAAGHQTSFAVLSDGSIEVWGGIQTTESPVSGLRDIPSDLGPVESLDVEHLRAVAINEDGQIVVWGNTSGDSWKPFGDIQGGAAASVGFDGFFDPIIALFDDKAPETLELSIGRGMDGSSTLQIFVQDADGFRLGTKRLESLELEVATTPHTSQWSAYPAIVDPATSAYLIQIEPNAPFQFFRLRQRDEN